MKNERTILIILFSAFFIIFYFSIAKQNKDNIHLSLLNNFSSTVSISNSSRGENRTNMSSIFIMGKNHYNQQNYLEAEKMFRASLDNKETNKAEIFYYLGLCQFELGNFQKAISSFSFSRINDPALYEDASWQILLCHLGLNQRKEAIQIGEEILWDETTIYKDRVLEIINKIES